MISAPKPIRPTASATWNARARYASLVCHRFIRRRTGSAPLCIGMCKCGATRPPEVRMSSRSNSSISVASMLPSRNRTSGTASKRRARSAGKRTRSLQVSAVVANVDPRQHEFGMVARQPPRLEHDVPGGAGATRTARKPRGAECALPVTTVLYLEPSPHRALAPVQDGRTDGFQMRSNQPAIHAELEQGSRRSARAGHRSGHLNRVVSRYNGGHTFQLGILPSPEHSGTPGDDDVRVGVFSLDTPNKTPRLGIGRIGHGTGIHHAYVGRA